MKVPTLTSQRTTPAQMVAAPARGQPNTLGAQAMAQGLGALGQAFTQLRATLEQREQATDRFDSLRRLSIMQEQAAERITELKRGYDPSGRGFVEAANKVFEPLEQEYLDRVPPDLQDEFQYRAQLVRQGVMSDALQFQYQSGDAWFRQGVADALDKAKVRIDQNPALLDQEQSHIVEIINATDLPEVTKIELARQATIGLAAAAYKAEVRANTLMRSSIGVGSAASVVDKIIGVESGGKANAKNPKSSASGLGQFTDSTWLATLDRHRPDLKGLSRAEKLALKTDPVIGREMTEAHTQDNINALRAAGLPTDDGSVYLAHFAGIGGAKRLLTASDDRPVIQILGPGAVKANPFLEGKTVGWVKAWAADKMDSAPIATDPRYEVIPFEDRLALRNDADSEAKALAAAEAARVRADREARQNELYLGLLDGRFGQLDVDNARAAGVLNDYDSVNKALNILKDRNEQILLAQGGYAKLETGAPFDPTSSDDKKMLNSMVKQSNGLDRIASGDRDYITQGIVPLVARAGDIPTDVAGALMGMVRGGQGDRMLYALDALAQLRDTNPIAFNQRVSDDVAKKVTFWSERKDILSKDELISALRGGLTAAERAAQDVLRSEAQKLLADKDNGLKKMTDAAINNMRSGWFSRTPVAVPLVRQAFEKDFQTAFIDEYTKSGDAAYAEKAAREATLRVWGVTKVGSGATLMKYPPEQMGYRPIEGSHDWINEQVREEMGLKEDETFHLFADEQTVNEFTEFQQSTDAAPPSYRVFIQDANGVFRERTDEETGLPLRMNFAPPQEKVERELRNFRLRDELYGVEETIDNYLRLQRGAWVNPLQPQEIPEEDTQAYEEALRRRDEIKRLLKEN